MKRVLSQPLLWLRNPGSPRDRADTDRNIPSPRPVGVHWAEESSEDESSPMKTSVEKALALSRRSSLSPAASRPAHGAAAAAADHHAHHQDELEVGVAMSADRQNPVLATAKLATVERSSTNSSATLNVLSDKANKGSATRFAGLFAGRGGMICADFLAKHLPPLVSETLEQFEDDPSAALKEAFALCDRDYNSAYPTDPSGSCAIAAIMQKRTITVAWTGECRALLCTGQEVKQLTFEHSPSNSLERRRVIDAGGLIAGGQVSGILATTRGFGDNDVKAHFSEGVFVAEPSLVSATVDENPKGLCFLVLVSQSVVEALGSSEAIAKVVSKALVGTGGRVTPSSSGGDHSASYAATKLARFASKRSNKSCGAAVVVWSDTAPRSRSSSAASWRSLRSFSTVENDE